MLVPALFEGFYSYLLLIFPFFILVGWIVHVHTIKISIFLVVEAPPRIFVIKSNFLFGFINAPGFKVGKSLNTNFVGVPSFSVILVSGKV